MSARFADHKVNLHRTLTTSVVVVPDSDGNVRIQESQGEDVLDVGDTSLVCDTCGVLGYDELADHGIAEMWEEV